MILCFQKYQIFYKHKKWSELFQFHNTSHNLFQHFKTHIKSDIERKFILLWFAKYILFWLVKFKINIHNKKIGNFYLEDMGSWGYGVMWAWGYEVMESKFDFIVLIKFIVHIKFIALTEFIVFMIWFFTRFNEFYDFLF